jgi:predicted unusual protein kinase regulating ubiquinone biosynthesis (AarF/ABC1/UbiB family)
MNDLQDKNTIVERWRRYAKVTGAMGGLAARMTGERVFGMTIDRERHAQELKAALGGIKGPLMKVAQILSTVPDLLPQEYVTELAQLQSNAPAMGWPFVRRRMQTELGPDWQSRFAEFGQSAAAAASLGQVHQARGLDGQLLACKLQYPDMAAAVEADLKQLRMLMALYERYDKAIHTQEIHQEIAERLWEELDYHRELQQMQLYHNMLAQEDGVQVPVGVPALSTSRLLSMSWLQGRAMMAVVDQPQEFRNQVALNMFRAWYVPFYHYGIIHGDPHMGNYSVREDGGVNLLDFGCIRVFPPPFVKGVIDLYQALQNNDNDLAVAAYESWGFGNLSKEIIAVLNQWAEFVYAPLMEDKVRRLQETNSGIYGREVAQAVHQQLRELGGVKPPREFVFMDRAAVGLGSVFLHLKAEINWYQLFHDLIGQFDVEAMAKRQQQALTDAGLVPTSHPV